MKVYLLMNEYGTPLCAYRSEEAAERALEKYVNTTTHPDAYVRAIDLKEYEEV